MGEIDLNGVWRSVVLTSSVTAELGTVGAMTEEMHDAFSLTVHIPRVTTAPAPAAPSRAAR